MKRSGLGIMALTAVMLLIGCDRVTGIDRDTPRMTVVDPKEPGPMALKGLPEDVLRFRGERDRCDHLRGEEAGDGPRAAVLAEGMKATCTGTDRRLASLRRKYADDRELTDLLTGYDDRIED